MPGFLYFFFRYTGFYFLYFLTGKTLTMLLGPGFGRFTHNPFPGSELQY